MARTLAGKMSAALAFLLLSTMLTTGLFGYLKFEAELSSLVRSRYSVVVFSIQHKIEDRLNLGLALRQLRQVQDLIELEKARDEQVLGIQVYDANREVLFDTERGAIGARVPAPWLVPLAGPANQPFSLTEDDQSLVGLPLVNTLGKVEGAVVLRYPAAYPGREMGQMLGRLSVEFILVLAGFAIAGTAAISLLLGKVRNRLRSMETALEKVMAQGGEAVPGADADRFEQAFAGFCTKARDAMGHIADAEADVERLDRLA